MTAAAFAGCGERRWRVDLLYSASLLLSLVSGGVTVLLGAAGILRSRPGGLAGSAAPVVLAVAVTSLLISVATHRYWGHGPASLEPMDNVRFILAHKAFVVAGAVTLAGLVLVMYGRRYRPSA